MCVGPCTCTNEWTQSICSTNQHPRSIMTLLRICQTSALILRVFTGKHYILMCTYNIYSFQLPKPQEQLVEKSFTFCIYQVNVLQIYLLLQFVYKNCSYESPVVQSRIKTKWGKHWSLYSVESWRFLPAKWLMELKKRWELLSASIWVLRIHGKNSLFYL